MLKRNLISSFVVLSSCCFASSDRCDSQDFSQQDRIYRDAQEHTGARDYERSATRDPWHLETGEDRSSCDGPANAVGTVGPPDRDR